MDYYSLFCVFILVFISILQSISSFENVNFRHSESQIMNQRLSYSAAALKAMKTKVNCFKPNVHLPKEITHTRKRGRKGGIRARLKRSNGKPPLPAIVTGNARSLNNKLDELQANVNYLCEYRNASLLAITETWFDCDDTNISLDNFTLYRGDRTAESGKQRGGGVCLFVNKRYCHPNHVQVTQDTCTPDVEILSASLRPYYLPREFPKVNVNIVYVPPDGNDSIAAQAISDVVNQQLTASPDSVVIVTGDFNTCVIDSYIPRFTRKLPNTERKDS